MRSFHLTRPARLAVLLAVAVLLGCGKSSDSTAPPAVTGPTWNFTFPQTGTSNQRFFTEVGTWDYRCTSHAGMNGTITVGASGVDSQVVNLIAGNQFSPPTVSLKTGGYIRWVNTSTTLNHTSTR